MNSSARNSNTPTSLGKVEVPAGLHVSAYDRVAGAIVAFLILVSFGVLVLVLLWLAGQALAGNGQAPVELAPELQADSAALGYEQEFVDPGVQEFADVQSPQLADTLAAVTTAVTTQQATLDELFGDSSELGTGEAAGNRNATGGSGNGEGDQRSPPMRILSLNVRSLTEYAQMLDALGMEMGVLGGGVDGIVYVSRLSAEKPAVRSGTGDAENRLYFPQDRALAELDQQLLSKASVPVQNRVIVYFVPPAVERQILQAEREFANRTPQDISQTLFGVRSEGDSYTFYVIEQQPRNRS